MTHLVVVVSWVVSAVQRVGVPGPVQALQPGPSLSSRLTRGARGASGASGASGGGGGVVHCTVLQDGLGGSAGFGGVGAGILVLGSLEYFSWSSGGSQWSQRSGPFQL